MVLHGKFFRIPGLLEKAQVFQDKNAPLRQALCTFKSITGRIVGSLSFTAGVSVENKLPLKNRLKNIHNCVMHYPVGERHNTYHSLFGVVNLKLNIF